LKTIAYRKYCTIGQNKPPAARRTSFLPIGGPLVFPDLAHKLTQQFSRINNKVLYFKHQSMLKSGMLKNNDAKER